MISRAAVPQYSPNVSVAQPHRAMVLFMFIYISHMEQSNIWLERNDREKCNISTVKFCCWSSGCSSHWLDLDPWKAEQALTQHAWPLPNLQGRLLRRGQRNLPALGKSMWKIWIFVLFRVHNHRYELFDTVCSLWSYFYSDMKHFTWQHAALTLLYPLYIWPPLLIET